MKIQNSKVYEKLENVLGKGRVVQNKNLFPYITLRTSTTAEYFFIAKSNEDNIAARKITTELDLPLLLLGGGSNIAPLQSPIKGLVVVNMCFKKEKIDETSEYVDLLVSSGYPMPRLVQETIADGLAGLEYHKGLPGTVGGAIFMNSKWTRPVCYVGDLLISAKLLDKTGDVRTVDRDYFEFAYDYSILQKTHEVILEVVLRLKKQDPSVLKQKALEAFTYRKQTQPYGVATSGCFFRNISEKDKNRLSLQTTSAGYLIDQSGLKGKQIGNFIVSDLHANFIINTSKNGEGNPQDLVELLKLIKDGVKEKFGVELVEEVVII